MDLAHGGHLTHGMKLNFSGRWYPTIGYGLDPSTERLDYDKIASLAREHKPKLILAGASAYARQIDFDTHRPGGSRSRRGVLRRHGPHRGSGRGRDCIPTPMPVADFVTSTTHKTLRGPRGGIALCKQEWAKKIDSAVFPGLQGGPLDARHRRQGGLLWRGASSPTSRSTPLR